MLVDGGDLVTPQNVIPEQGKKGVSLLHLQRNSMVIKKLIFQKLMHSSSKHLISCSLQEQNCIAVEPALTLAKPISTMFCSVGE